ncbi:MAG: hypothetical protein K2I21_01495 [Acetatifactor sp.]|nr:hypothetical protein [Acetatifactor sp.]
MLFFLKVLGLQLTLVLAVLRLIGVLDPSHGLKTDGAAVGILLAGCGAGAGYIVHSHSGATPGVWLGYLALAVYLTVCTITDIQTSRVYDILQVPAAAAGAWLCIRQPAAAGSGTGLILFALLQYLLFMRLYGEGDVMAFQICALYLAGGGGNFLTMLLHMALAFAMLGAIQLAKGNINRKGNLKNPVPFLPYIACSVLWFL